MLALAHLEVFHLATSLAIVCAPINVDGGRSKQEVGRYPKYRVYCSPFNAHPSADHHRDPAGYVRVPTRRRPDRNI
jgi:hypothetical protein